MQQPPQMIPMMPSYPSANITTEQIQKYLDENKKLILAILDNQNLGKLAECAQYQALLQKNLMYLAAIADAQPQTPAMPPQMAPHPAMQQGGAYFMQHPQAAAMAQQSGGIFPPKLPLPFNNPHQVQDPQQLHHQAALQGQMGMRPNNGILGGGGGLSSATGASNKQDAPQTGPSGADGQGNSGGDVAEDAK